MGWGGEGAKGESGRKRDLTGSGGCGGVVLVGPWWSATVTYPSTIYKHHRRGGRYKTHTQHQVAMVRSRGHRGRDKVKLNVKSYKNCEDMLEGSQNGTVQ